MYVLTRSLEKVAYEDQYAQSSGGGAGLTGGALLGGAGVGAAAYGVHKYKTNKLVQGHAAQIAGQAASHADDLAKATGPMAHIKNFAAGMTEGFGQGVGGGATAEAMKNPKVRKVVNTVDEALHGTKGGYAATPKMNSVYGDFNPNVNKAPKTPWRQRVAESIAGKKFHPEGGFAATPKGPMVDDTVEAGRAFGAKIVRGAGKYGPKAAEAAGRAAKSAAGATVNAAKATGRAAAGAAKATGGAAASAANFVKEKATAAASAFKPKPTFTESMAAGAAKVFKTVGKYGNILRKVASQLEEIKVAAYNDEMKKLTNK